MNNSTAISSPWSRWNDIMAMSLLAIAAGALITPAMAHAIELWSTTEEFSYGFLIIPISVALVLLRRDQLRAWERRGQRYGLAVLGIALVAYVIAQRTEIHAVAGLAISPLLWGMTMYLFGWSVARAVAFPVWFLAFGFAPYRGLLDTVGFDLQVITADGVAALGAAIGLPVTLNGLVLQLPQFAFVVAEACSGMSSLLSLLALASVWIYLARASVLARLGVILSILPLVIGANIARVTLVLIVALQWGPDAAVGFFHGASSLILFGVALLSMLIVSKVVGCRLPAAR